MIFLDETEWKILLLFHFERKINLDFFVKIALF